MMPTLLVLGPQRFQPTLRPVLDSIGVRGPVAVVTAGWQERELEDGELREHLDCEVTNLELYARYEEAVGQDGELAAALRERQEQLQELQALYRVQLDHALAAARELLERSSRSAALLEQRSSAVRALRAVDRQHLQRIARIHEAFERRFEPARRPAVARLRERLAQQLEPCAALAIAGGHVAVLLNRLRLFDLPQLAGERPIVAWSAGAMALSERVVLFHDHPPQGAGNAEVLEVGLGVVPRLVALPSARQRLRLEDPVRVALFARRFAPAICALLDPGARLDWDGRSWRAAEGTRRLSSRGGLPRIAA